MVMEFRYRKEFEKNMKKLHPKIKEKVKERLTIFSTDPFHPLLRNHALHGIYNGLRSIDVTGNIRIIFRQVNAQTYEIIELLDIGTHSELYE